ncbi:MAG: hypothetical protein JXA30_18275, partial [Deltaproteobacteria bacterium]|nr:hypothetical protein [Deltaproteobacteria bacterium]
PTSRRVSIYISAVQFYSSRISVTFVFTNIQKARQAELTIPPLHDGRLAQSKGLEIDSMYRDTRAQLDSCRDSDQRAECAFEILADHCEAKGGYLYGLQVDGLRTLWNENGNPVPQQLLETVRVYLEAELKDSTEATITEADEHAAEGSNPAYVLEDGTRVELVSVHGLQQNQPVVVGVAALVPARGQLLAADPQVVRAISDALLEKGDVASWVAA